MPQLDSRLLALLFVTGADFLPFAVSHQWQVDCCGKRTLGKLDGRTSINQRQILQKNAFVVAAIDHQITSTANSPCACSSPMDASCKPKRAANCTNSASPSASTANNKPPLVCGSHNQ